MSERLQTRGMYGLVFIANLPTSAIFRYRGKFFKKVDQEMAREIDWESGDFLYLGDLDIRYDVCAMLPESNNTSFDRGFYDCLN